MGQIIIVGLECSAGGGPYYRHLAFLHFSFFFYLSTGVELRHVGRDFQLYIYNNEFKNMFFSVKF
jgi:hypothetical protein